MTIEVSNDPGLFGDFEHRGWETVSSGYQQHFARLTSQSVAAILDAARVSAGMQVLDVCCGPGMIAAAAAQRDAKAVGLDFSAEAVAIASANVPACQFQEGDAQALPFEDDSFDAVVCGFGIIHLPNPQQALAEMLRVLKPGGRVAVSVWERPGADNGFGLLFAAIKAHGDMNVSLPHGPDFFQFSDAASLTAALRLTGLREARVQQVAQTWMLGDPLGLVNSVMEGAVRARGLLLAQTEAVRQLIFAQIANGMAQYQSADGGYQVPMPALVGSGTK